MLAHDMGAGKTKTAIDYCNAIDAKLVLVICPKAVIPVWPLNVERHSFLDYECLELNKGPVKAKTEELQKFVQHIKRKGRRGIVIVNYESAWRAPLGPVYNRKNRIVDEGTILSTNWDAVILDESHRIKAPGGKASWFCKRLGRKVNRRLCLTGTPFPHSPLDVYAQFRFLEPEIYGTSFSRFRARYAVMGGYNNRQVIQWQGLDELEQKFFSRAHRVRKEDVLDLPDVLHEQIRFGLDNKAMKTYREVEEDFVSKLEDGQITVENALTKLLRLQQITGGNLQLDDGRNRRIDESKLDVLRDIVADLTGEAVVIFVRFRPEIEQIKVALKKQGRKCFELSGKANELKQWQEHPENEILVAQLQSGQEGVDLTRSRYCVYYSMGFSLGGYEQSLARTHRPGQTRKVTYYHLIAKNTIDVTVYRSLREKKEVVEAIINHIKEGGEDE